MRWLNRHIKAFGEDRFETLLPEITWNGLFQANDLGHATFLEAYMQRRAVYRKAEERFDNVQDEIRASGTETLWTKSISIYCEVPRGRAWQVILLEQERILHRKTCWAE